MERILMLLYAATAQSVESLLRSARDQAADPDRISFGLLLTEEPDEDGRKLMNTLGMVAYKAPGSSPWADAAALWQGEGFMLRAHPAMIFRRNWDMTLLHALRVCSDASGVPSALTGVLPGPDDPVDAMYPLAADAVTEEGALRLRKGIPLRYAVRPQQTAFLNPEFIFGPAAFWREMAAADGEPSLCAFRLGWSLYTPNRVAISMGAECPLPTVSADSGDDAAFRTRFSLENARELSPQARTGLFNPDCDFPRKLPAPAALQEKFRALAHARSRLKPLVVTRFCYDREPDGNLPGEDLVAFRFLTQLENMPLLCFSDLEMMGHLLPLAPNVMEYKRRYEVQLPQSAVAGRSERIAVSKLALLTVARDKQLNHTHYIWLDRGALRFPVAPKAWLSWDRLCGSRVRLATVDGVPDPCMIVVPEHLLPDMTAEVSRRCLENLKLTGSLPTEEQLWKGILHDLPELAEGVPMPRRGMLILQLMNPRGKEWTTSAV